MLSACVRNTAVKERLLAVESIIEEYPDSALAVLRSMDSVSVHKIEETQALHALLLTQAFDKNYIDVKDDSLISIAVRYYEESDDIFHRMLAHFYHGRVLYNASNYPQSIVSTFKAYDEATDIGDQYWLAMIARSISSIYSQTYSYIESLEYAKKALEHFRQTNKQKHINWAYWTLAVAYRNCKLWDDCIRTATQGLDSAHKYNEPHLTYELTRIIGSSHFNAKRYTESIEAYSKLCNEYKGATASDSVFLGLCYKRTGNTGKADEILSALPQDLDTYGSWLQNELCIERGDTITAYNALLTLYNHTDNIVKTFMHQNMNGTISQYLDTERLIEEDKAEQAKLRNWFIIAIAIILFVATGIIVYRYYRKQRKIIEENVSIAEHLREILTLNENKHSELQQKMSKLFESHFETLNKLCDNVYVTQSMKDHKKHVSNLVTKLIKDFANKTATLEKLADEHYDNVISDFKHDFPRINQEEYMVFLYNIFGLSYNAIALLLKKEKASSLYNHKRHLKDKIKSSDSPSKEKYAHFLN